MNSSVVLFSDLISSLKTQFENSLIFGVSYNTSFNLYQYLLDKYNIKKVSNLPKCVSKLMQNEYVDYKEKMESKSREMLDIIDSLYDLSIGAYKFYAKLCLADRYDYVNNLMSDTNFNKLVSVALIEYAIDNDSSMIDKIKSLIIT